MFRKRCHSHIHYYCHITITVIQSPKENKRGMKLEPSITVTVIRVYRNNPILFLFYVPQTMLLSVIQSRKENETRDTVTTDVTSERGANEKRGRNGYLGGHHWIVTEFSS